MQRLRAVDIDAAQMVEAVRVHNSIAFAVGGYAASII